MNQISQPWLDYKETFQLCSNLWHIGGISNPSYLLDTGDGLLLLDTGGPYTAYQIIQHINELKKNVLDVRWILHSHGHIDHFGSTRVISELTGAKTYIGAEDKNIANGTLDLSWAKELNTVYNAPFEADVLLHDGDILHFGNTTFKCLAAPGHTQGTMAYFFNVEDNGTELRAGMHGGVGFNSMQMSFLRKYGLSANCRKQFLHGLERLKKEHVDIFVGNHLPNNHSDEKIQMKKQNPDGKNPFIDSSEWHRFLTQTEINFQHFLANDN